MEIYKTLKYLDQYVDFYLLYKGIYGAPIPQLFHSNTTMDNLKERINELNPLWGGKNDAIKNLEQCELAEVIIAPYIRKIDKRF